MPALATPSSIRKKAESASRRRWNGRSGSPMASTATSGEPGSAAGGRRLVHQRGGDQDQRGKGARRDRAVGELREAGPRCEEGGRRKHRRQCERREQEIHQFEDRPRGCARAEALRTDRVPVEKQADQQCQGAEPGQQAAAVEGTGVGLQAFHVAPPTPAGRGLLRAGCFRACASAAQRAWSAALAGPGSALAASRAAR